jgi:hypothetical protein
LNQQRQVHTGRTQSREEAEAYHGKTYSERATIGRQAGRVPAIRSHLSIGRHSQNVLSR